MWDIILFTLQLAIPTCMIINIIHRHGDTKWAYLMCRLTAKHLSAAIAAIELIVTIVLVFAIIAVATHVYGS